MNLAIINQQTNVVENVIVPPAGTDAYSIAEGYIGVLTDTGGIGYTYENGQFVPPPPPPEEIVQEVIPE